MQRIISHSILYFTTVCLGAVLLASCSGSTTSIAPSDSTGLVQPTDGSGEFNITDAMGRLIAFKTAPKRIVLVGRGVIMLADGVYFFPEASSRLVAIGKTSQWKSDFVPIVDPHFEDKTILETEAGPEQIAPLQPDLVLMKSYMAEKLGKSVEALGIPVVYLDFETPEQYPRDVITLGEIFQNQARAKEVIDFYRQRQDRVEQALAGLDQDEQPRILICYYSDKDGQTAFNVPPVNWMQTRMAEIAGGRPVWKDIELGNGWTKVNFEQIAAWDPDQVFIVGYTNDALEVVAGLKDNPQWQALRAVKNEKMFAFPADVYSWDQPDTRWILGLTWLASTLHPDKFPELDMKQEVEDFYRQLYELDETTIQEKIMPTLEFDFK